MNGIVCRSSFVVRRGWGLEAFCRGRYEKLGVESKWVPGNNGARAGDHELGKVAADAGMSEAELLGLLTGAHARLAKGNEGR